VIAAFYLTASNHKFDGKLYFSLPNSGIEGSVSHKVFKRSKRSLNREKTIYPDVSVEVDFYDKYLKGIDSAWNAVLQIIEGDKE